MHLKSITLKGFKSFPDRTRLEFGPGVSVVVGPNGSGKSNVTDAVLWAMGEQSPLAVRGQSMQDVIFGGGRGVQARSHAEVEIVLDNSAGDLDVPMSEISVSRSLDRSGEGEYRINGARCRLVDVIEVLSDTGLGKEMHSVISQGRVESIVTSKPRERRLLIEEAAGLGKHRKRRRRAQLKLDRTQDNLDRALDVEREARSRLRPLKRQAEAAELHERLERQVRQAQWELERDLLRTRQAELAEAEDAVAAARAERESVEAQMAEVAGRREAAERSLAQRSERRDELSRRSYAVRSALQRCELRLEQTQRQAEELAERVIRRQAELAALGDERAPAASEAPGRRLAELEAQLDELESARERELDAEVAGLRSQSAEARDRAAAAEAELASQGQASETARGAVEAARAALQAAEVAAATARRASASVGAELAAANHFLRGLTAGDDRSLGAQLRVREGAELALAAVLGGRLGAAIVEDLPAGLALLERLGADGGQALVAQTGGAAVPASEPPTSSAERLLDLVQGPAGALDLATRLLADAWLVEDLGGLRPSFDGVAVTRSGRAWFAGTGELRQAVAGSEERTLAERNRRERLIGESERAASGVVSADRQLARCAAELAEREHEQEQAHRRHRERQRDHAEALEDRRRLEWLIEQRRAAPDHGPTAVRRAELAGELAAERRAVTREAAERAARAARRQALTLQVQADRELAPRALRLGASIEMAINALRVRASSLDAELEADRQAGESVSLELRACAAAEAEIQTRLRAQGEAVTEAEVRAQRARDQAAETAEQLGELAQLLGLSPDPAPEALPEDQREQLAQRRGRLERRREQLGPVNPLAQEEYAEALEHVETLEAQRGDLEAALRELRKLIRDTDRQIRETFEQTFTAAARNFEALAEEMFPGGRGRLRLVREEAGPRPVLGGAEPPAPDEPLGEPESGAGEAGAGGVGADGIDPPETGLSPDELLGVEIEITPAGKSMKRLSLLSGGEKSMTAIAFLFAVFLARPCPFYILDEVEAALDDLNISRFLRLLRRHSGQAQFIVVTHQKRTMEAADSLYGVSMGEDGVSKVISRRLPADLAGELEGVESAPDLRASAGAA
ncbi:MAG TPA: AAA family ATPase [Solirubrobacteraceae bacterium]|jgi:chromosome segregation protein|nr:AAA family ATPase [Solirubrobacteraceae bacterium]